MSRVADFDRSLAGMRALFARVTDLRECFFDRVTVSDAAETADLFRLYDTVVTMCATLSAMITSGETIGTHGSALVDRKAATETDARKTRTLTEGDRSYLAPVSPMPDPELWFETLLARQRAKEVKK